MQQHIKGLGCGDEVEHVLNKRTSGQGEVEAEHQGWAARMRAGGMTKNVGTTTRASPNGVVCCDPRVLPKTGAQIENGREGQVARRSNIWRH